jgi:hypothetical protein
VHHIEQARPLAVETVEIAGDEFWIPDTFNAGRTAVM